jgi:hypothetical protein
MWLLQGNPPPSHGMINAFRKKLLREVIEKLLYDLIGLPQATGYAGGK